MTMLHPQSREQWLDLRRQFVSSSESSALFGLNKYTTAYELALVKSGKIPDSDESNERTAWGQLLEGTIAKQFASEAGLKVRSLSAYADAGGGMGSSFDFEIVGGLTDSDFAQMYRQHGPGILEIKNVDAYIYRNEWTKEEAPEHIECQVQHQLEACGRPWAVIAVLVGGNRLDCYLRMRDGEVGSALRQRIGRFWSDLAAGTLPEPILPRDADLVAALYRGSVKGEVANLSENETVRDLVRMCYLSGEAERRAADSKKSMKAAILPLIGTASKVIVGDYTISCGEVPATEIAYTRASYRNFRITQRKERPE
jgi:putative phage-type endonuclease